jgi:hypothetical protein
LQFRKLVSQNLFIVRRKFNSFSERELSHHGFSSVHGRSEGPNWRATSTVSCLILTGHFLNILHISYRVLASSNMINISLARMEADDHGKHDVIYIQLYIYYISLCLEVSTNGVHVCLRSSFNFPSQTCLDRTVGLDNIQLIYALGT